MNQKNLSKILSTGLSLALAVSSMPISAGAVGPEAIAPAFVSKLTPPEQFGYVASSFAPNGEEKPRLIIISDLHGHLEVQHNIMGMLDHFVKTLTADKSSDSQSHVPIFVEGGWEQHLEAPLKAVADKVVRLKLAHYLLEKAELSAAQTFSEENVGSTKITLTGAENKAEYEMNRQRFAQTYPARKTLLEAIAQEEKTLHTVMDSVSNGSTQKLRTLRADYDKGLLSQVRYAKALLNFARRAGVEGRDVELIKNLETADASQVEVALTKVQQQVEQATAASKPVKAYLRPSLPNEDQIRKNTAYVDSRLDLLKRLVGNQLTPEEVPLALSKMPELVQVAEILLKDSKVTVDVRGTVQQALDFYPFAFMRDESLVENSLQALDKDPQHVSTGILIAGGFHADGIAQYLREHRIAYLMIHPVITRDIAAVEQLNYIRRVCDDHVTPMEVRYDLAQANTRLNNATPIEAPVTNLAGNATAILPNATALAQEIASPQTKTTKNPPVDGYGAVGFNPGMLAGTEGAVTHDAKDADFLSGVKTLMQEGFAGTAAPAELAELAKASDIQFDAVAGKSVVLELQNGLYVATEGSEHAGVSNLVNQVNLQYIDTVRKPAKLSVYAVKGTVDTKFQTSGQRNKGEWQIFKRQAAIVEDAKTGNSVMLLGEKTFDQAAAPSKTGQMSEAEIQATHVGIHETAHLGGLKEFGTLLLGFAATAVIVDATENGVDATKTVHQVSLATVKRVLKAISNDQTEAGTLAGEVLAKLEAAPDFTADKLYTAKEIATLFGNLVSEPVMSDAVVAKYAAEYGLPEETVRLAMADSFALRVMGYPEPEGAPKDFLTGLAKLAADLRLKATQA